MIRVCGNDNIKDSCEEIGWGIQESGLVIRYKEHQSVDSNAQVMLMCIPSVFDWDGIEGENLWHFSEIEKSLLKKGKLPTEFVRQPLPEISVSWRQNKQGKEKKKAEESLSVNNLVGFQKNGCLVCTIKVVELDWKCLFVLCECFNKMGLCHRALGRKCLMIVNYNG